MKRFDALTKEEKEQALRRLEHLAVHKGTPERIAEDLGIVIGLAWVEFRRTYPTSHTEG